jgi:hypothetical protein
VDAVAHYGPDNHLASKVIAAVIPHQNGGPEDVRKWFSQDADIRQNTQIIAAVIQFLQENRVRTFALTPGI